MSAARSLRSSAGSPVRLNRFSFAGAVSGALLTQAWSSPCWTRPLSSRRRPPPLPWCGRTAHFPRPGWSNHSRWHLALSHSARPDARPSTLRRQQKTSPLLSCVSCVSRLSRVSPSGAFDSKSDDHLWFSFGGALMFPHCTHAIDHVGSRRPPSAAMGRADGRARNAPRRSASDGEPTASAWWWEESWIFAIVSC